MSNDTRWTPGPWRAVVRPGMVPGAAVAFDINGDDHFNIASGQSQEHIGITGIQHDAVDANARLIAAAPELYAALQVAELVMRERGLRALGEYRQIAAALAKAAGAGA